MSDFVDVMLLSAKEAEDWRAPCEGFGSRLSLQQDGESLVLFFPCEKDRGATKLSVERTALVLRGWAASMEREAEKWAG